MIRYEIPENIINAAKKKGKQLSNLLDKPLPTNYEVGQIWSTSQLLSLGERDFYTDEPKIVVILDVKQDEFSLVTAAPISTEIYFASEYDLIISKHDSPLGFEFMIEVWNETPVYEKHLKNFYGSLFDNVFHLLAQINSFQLNNDSIPQTLSSWVGLKIFSEEDPRLEFQEKEVMAISYLTEAATFNVSLSLPGLKESIIESFVSKTFFSIKPLFGKLSNYEQLMSRKLALASSEFENNTFILASPDEGKKFIFELQEGLPPTKEMFLFVHFISKEFENKKCFTHIVAKNSRFDFPAFILKTGLEVKVPVNPDFNMVDVFNAEVIIE